MPANKLTNITSNPEVMKGYQGHMGCKDCQPAHAEVRHATAADQDWGSSSRSFIPGITRSKALVRRAVFAVFFTAKGADALKIPQTRISDEAYQSSLVIAL